MTVESSAIKVLYEGNGINRLWPVPFRIPPTDDYLFVMVKNSRFTQGLLTTDFEVQGIGSEQISIVYPRPGSDTPPLAVGEQLLIYRELPLKQFVRFKDNQPFHASSHEGKFDWLCMTDQQLQEQLDRCLKVGLAWDDEVPTVDEFMDTMDEYIRRAENAADRGEDAAAWAEAVYRLAGQTANIRISWLADKDYPAYSEMPLKVYYYPGRHMLHLSCNSLACVPESAALNANLLYQYSELGELDALSNRVQVNFDIKQGDMLDAWVISSLTQEQFDEIFASMQAALDAAQRAEAAAQRAAEYAAYQALAGQTANVSAAWLAANDIEAGGELILPEFYWPGRRQFMLFHNSLPCVELRATVGSQAAHQYEEIGEADALSNRIRVNFPVQAGDVFYLYVLSSITQKMFDDTTAMLDETRQYVEGELLNIESASTAAANNINEANSAFTAKAEQAQAILDNAIALSQQVEGLSNPVIQLDINGVEADSDYTVPGYTVGSNRLEIYIEGLLCSQGNDPELHQFVEAGEADQVSATIRFYDSYPMGTQITAISRG